ncbi:SDR family NAD(P)-dependent oxidoreductase [Kordiimonas pumila]|uniref:SDR family NAD(P)-dependent oxidoreductase n=1 Tax=Kordiimonas pumila TaxID=2161677 RepID=A0ABV7D3T9_9PROT|nr:SDR family NAD(P)-dependent oxidoreductase [Kordiimonas pumila]
MDKSSLYSLKQQRAVITGAASGIGAATARLFARAGADLVLLDLNAEKLKSIAEDLQADGAVVHTLSVDVSRPEQVKKTIDEASQLMGGIDILVHSAGVGVERGFLETTDADWQRIIDIDLSGTFYVMREAGRIMAEAGYGRIVTLSSTAGVRGGTFRAAYGAAKAGVIMLSRTLAVELASKNVTVNCLAPGAIDTELVQEMHSKLTRELYQAAIPANRYGLPEDVAHAALFLALPQSAYITGHVLAVDGGFLGAGLQIR